MTELTKAEIMLNQVTKSNSLIRQLELCKNRPIPPLRLDLRPSTKSTIKAFQENVQGRIDQLTAQRETVLALVEQIPPYATEEAKAKYWSGYTGGNLRDNWSVLPIEKKGNDYIVTVINNAQYASYVEYGHRQQPGRFVPALGLRLKQSWVPGRYMLTISTQELEQQAPKLIEQKLYQFLRPIFENG